MHYILLAIALNLGKENISYMNLADSKKMAVARADAKNQKSQKENDSANLPANNLENNLKAAALAPDDSLALPVVAPDDNILPMLPEDTGLDSGTFLNNDSEFEAPYVGSDSFAELLPEDEAGNVVMTDEEQGPKFLEAIKKRLIALTESKRKESILGSQMEGPAFFDSIKDEVLGGTEKLKDTIAKTQLNITDIADKTQQVTKGGDIENKAVAVIDNLKTKTAEVGDKLKNIDIKTPDFMDSLKDKIANIGSGGSGSSKEDDIPKLKIVGTLFDSELNQALKTQKKVQDDVLSRYMNSNEVKYVEDEDFQRFLDAKKPPEIVGEVDLFSIPTNIKPKEKYIISYKTKSVPEELLEPRSFQNRHIPKIMTNRDRENLLEKIIEYGMLTELKAFMLGIRDANLVMDNQYTLLTFATKNRQYDIMKYLLFIGANPNKRDDRLDTPLIVAVRNNDLEAVKILMGANANPNMLDILKRTPLIYAIEKNYEPVAIYLIDNGADVNITNGVGEGMLSMAVRLGRNPIKEKIVDILRKENKEESIVEMDISN